MSKRAGDEEPAATTRGKRRNRRIRRPFQAFYNTLWRQGIWGKRDAVISFNDKIGMQNVHLIRQQALNIGSPKIVQTILQVSKSGNLDICAEVALATTHEG
ncbi:hypothetical protein OROGR_008328 [Orobanche gracilis]